jgi:hypothetical protein
MRYVSSMSNMTAARCGLTRLGHGCHTPCVTAVTADEATEAHSYALFVKQIATGRLAQVVGRYADNAPTATACCMTCRTCVTSNLLALAAMPVLAAWGFVRRRRT